jgi:transposase
VGPGSEGEHPRRVRKGQVLMASRKFSPQFKLQIVREFESGENRVSQLCREHALSDSLVRRWVQQYRERGADAFRADDPRADELEAARKRIAELESALGRATLEVDFLRRCVKRANIPLPDGARW